MTLVQLSTRLNPVFTAILRSPFHWLLSPPLMLITVTGRRTGRRYTTPVAYQQMADAIVILVGEAPRKMWWRNYRTPGPIELRLRRQCLNGTAEVAPPEAAEFRRCFEAASRRARFLARIFGIDWNRHTGLTDTQVKQLGECAAAVRVSAAK
jgi:deazaflavin-dependent oxidoreductase (nitroreductase family)